MWPKAFAQFIELAPHISRLLPMADRFFQSKTASDDVNRKAIDALGANLTGSAERLRSDLREIALQQATLTDQLGDTGARLKRLAEDVAATKIATLSFDQRLDHLEARQGRVVALLIAVLLVLLALAAFVAFSIAHLR